jgi:hypothetical protein
MGAQQSIGQQEAQATARGVSVEQAYQEVNRRGNALVTQALRAGWTPDDVDQLCSRVAFIARDMFNWLDLGQLAGIQGRLGITLSVPFDLTASQEAELRRRACALVADYFAAKVRVAAFIRQNVRALCQDMRDVIARNMPAMLQGATDQQRNEAYARLARLDDALERWYRRLAEILGALAADIPFDRVERLADIAQDFITTGYRECCRAVYSLRDFAWQPVAGGGGALGAAVPQFVNRLLPGEPTVVGMLPRIVVTGLSGPAEAGTAVCGAPVSLANADLSQWI